MCALPKRFDIGCFSHTIDHVGEKFNTPVLKEFTSDCISFSHAVQQKLAWKSQTDCAIRNLLRHKVVVSLGGNEANS